MRTVLQRALLLWLTCLLVACNKEPATQVLVTVRGDLGDDVASVEAQLFDETEQKPSAPRAFTQKIPFSFAILPAESSPKPQVLVVLTAKGAAGQLIAQAKGLATFERGQFVALDIWLLQACRGVVCANGQTCLASGAALGICGPTQETGRRVSRDDFKAGEELTDMMFGNSTMPDASVGSVMGNDAGGTGGTGGSGISGPGAPDASGSANPPPNMNPPPGTNGDSGAPDTGSGPDTNLDAGGGDPVAECDATRACNAGYVCSTGKCVSQCEQTRCDANATCALMSGAPICSCNTGYIATSGSGVNVVCAQDRQCSELGCDVNATCSVGTDQLRHCTCKPGYTGSGTSCSPVSCDPLSIANGTVAVGTGSYGATATYTCNTGYTKTGGSARKCEVSGWSGSAPTCDAFDCRLPSNPSRGNVSAPTGTKYPNGTLSYTCNTGFQLSGSATRMCTANGWSGTAPTCLGCGDGTISPALRETCDTGILGTSPWTCDPVKCTKTTMYNGCNDTSDCSSGENCFTTGCTHGCDVGCPAGPSGGGRTMCLSGFACAVGCSSTSNCPPGLVCDTTNGFCTGCQVGTGPACPLFTTCVMGTTMGRCL